jgi:hypothetical protein
MVCLMAAKMKIEAEDVTTRSRIGLVEQVSRKAILEPVPTILDAGKKEVSAAATASDPAMLDVVKKIPVATAARGSTMLDAEKQISAATTARGPAMLNAEQVSTMSDAEKLSAATTARGSAMLNAE